MKLPKENIFRIANNAGAHNSIYRGEDITDLFYDGTLSEQIANGTFDDIFIGDYIIGESTGSKYFVADIDYELNTGSSALTTHHVLMIPELIFGNAPINDSGGTNGGYINSDMRTSHLENYKMYIRNDFGTNHILTYDQYLCDTVTDNYESNKDWYSADIELMNEIMVFSCRLYNNERQGTESAANATIDNAQLSLFRLDKSKSIAFDRNGDRVTYWLRDVASAYNFCCVTYNGRASTYGSANYYGVRPFFLIY